MRISDWSSDVCSSDLYLRKQREGSDRGVVPAAIVALRHNHVDAVIDHLLGVLDLADHRHDPGAIGMKAVHPRSGMAEAGGIDWHLFLDYHFHLRLEKLPREQLRTALAHFRRASRAHGHCGIHFGQIQDRKGGKEWVSQCRSRWSPVH